MTDAEGVKQALKTALSAMQSGQFDTAIDVCQNVLERHSGSGDALHILALSQRGKGDIISAEKAIKRAAKKLPGNPSILNSYGLITLDAGRPIPASRLFRKALKLDTKFAAAHGNLGHALAKSRHIDEARTSYYTALTLNPSLTDAFINLALLLRSADHISEIESLLTQFLKTNSRGPAVCFVEGLIALDKGQPENAEKIFREGLEYDPSSQSILVNLGVSLSKQGKNKPAIDVFNRALKRSPDDTDIHINLADALKYDSPTTARNHINAALLQKPEDLNARDMLGFTWLLEGDLGKAISEFDKVLAVEPGYERAVFHKAGALFLSGELEKAWSYYMNLYGTSGLRGSPIGESLEIASAGEIISQKTLVWTDQGIGDEILQLSMVSDLVKQNAPICIATSKRLIPLVTRSFPNTHCRNRETLTKQDIDVLNLTRQIPAAAIGTFNRRKMDDFPNHGGFLNANKQAIDELRKKYKRISEGRPIVGLSWISTNTEFGTQKSISLSALAPILANEQFCFLDLQYGNTDKEIQSLHHDVRRRFIQDQDIDPLSDLDIFAAQILSVDLVITISNSTAHIAGALGCPTWVLVPKPGPGWLWYWFTEREDSPWYPSVHLFRQSQNRDWTPALASIRQRLGTFFPK